MGGTNTAKLIDDAGPWSDYEFIDGHEKGAVVGVRRKDDPTGPVFTPRDMERLPNMKLSEEARAAQQAKWLTEENGTDEK